MNRESATTVGFIGLGAMGGAIVGRLIEQGYNLVVFDIDAPAVERARRLGAQAAASAKEVAERAEVVFVSLPSAAVSREAIFGTRGLVSARTVRTVIELSTIGSRCAIEFAGRLAAHDIAFLDAPVSGSSLAVAAGGLAIMVAGAKPCFDAHHALLQRFAARIFHVSDSPGAAQLCKTINNFIAMAGLAAACEGVALAMKEGLDPATVVEIVNAGSGRNWATSTLLPASILQGKFTGTGPIQIGLKDLGLYLEESARLQGITPFGVRLESLWRTIVESGDPRRDTTELLYYFAGRDHQWLRTEST